MVSAPMSDGGKVQRAMMASGMRAVPLSRLKTRQKSRYHGSYCTGVLLPQLAQLALLALLSSVVSVINAVMLVLPHDGYCCHCFCSA